MVWVGVSGVSVCVSCTYTHASSTHTHNMHILAHLVHTSSTRIYYRNIDDLVQSSRESSRD